MRTGVCEMCGNALPPSKRKYCSPECLKKAQYIQHKRRAAAIIATPIFVGKNPLATNCKNCGYHGSMNSNQKYICCDYALITGQIRPCPPGDACTVKVVGAKITKEDNKNEEIT